MTRHHFNHHLLVAFALSLIAGCGDARPARDEMSPAEFFNETQDGTTTPHGRVVPGSARDVGGGRIRYDTEDGSSFETTVTPNHQGGYRFRDPEQIEPERNE